MSVDYSDVTRAEGPEIGVRQYDLNWISVQKGCFIADIFFEFRIFPPNLETSSR